jgi:hypothetical protein
MTAPKRIKPAGVYAWYAGKPEQIYFSFKAAPVRKDTSLMVYKTKILKLM